MDLDNLKYTTISSSSIYLIPVMILTNMAFVQIANHRSRVTWTCTTQLMREPAKD